MQPPLHTLFEPHPDTRFGVGMEFRAVVSIKHSAGLTPRAGTGLHLGGACDPEQSNGKVSCGVGLAIYVHIACLCYFLLTLCSVQT